MGISKTEFNELYGDVEVKFNSYYKFTFEFRGETKTFETISISFGGGADDIYKESIEAGETVKVKDIDGRYATVYTDSTCLEVVHSYTDF